MRTRPCCGPTATRSADADSPILSGLTDILLETATRKAHAAQARTREPARGETPRVVYQASCDRIIDKRGRIQVVPIDDHIQDRRRTLMLHG